MQGIEDTVPRIAWHAHPDAGLESALANGTPQDLMRLLGHPRVSADPYATLRVVDALFRHLPGDESIELRWMQALLLANRPQPVWDRIVRWRLDPDASPIDRLFLAAQVARVMGEKDTARACFLGVLRRVPDAIDAWQKYLEFESPDRYPADARAILQNLHSAGSDDYTREKSAFALATLLDRDMPREAFALAGEGHRLKHHRLPAWDAAAFRTALDTDRAWVSHAKASTTPPDLVFVVGLPRSGTTLVSSILGAHTDVTVAGEQNLIPFLAMGPCRDPGQAASPQLGDFVRRWYAAATGDIRGRAQVLIDKLPGNVEHAGLILALFDNAIVLHIERDAMDCASSIHMHDFEHGCAYADRPTDLAAYASGISRHAAAIQASCPGRYLRVRYESLVEDPAAALSPLMQSLGLQWEASMLDFWRNSQSIASFSEAQVRAPVNRNAIGRWQRYLPEAQPFFDTIANS